MIGFIKNLFSGIISFFTGLFGGKKSKENKLSPTSSAKKLAEATTSSAEKLVEATTSSAEKLAEATTKTSNEAVSSVTGLFSDKKSQEKKRKRNGYFMELDDTDQMQSSNGNKSAKTETAKKPEPATAAKTAKKPEPATTAKAAQQEPAKSAKQEPAKTQSNTEQPKKRVEFVQTATEIKEVVKTEPAKPVASANGQNENTFAPKYLTPTSSNSRRRPGPSMSNFLDMARQVKSPAK